MVKEIYHFIYQKNQGEIFKYFFINIINNINFINKVNL